MAGEKIKDLSDLCGYEPTKNYYRNRSRETVSKGKILTFNVSN